MIKYKELYNIDFKLQNKLITSCNICYSHTLNNPVITYYDKKYKDIYYDVDINDTTRKTYTLSRSYRKK